MLLMMGLMWLVPLVLVMAAAYGLGLRPRGNEKSATETGEDALEVLMRRYAKGEITREEFDQVRSDLAAGL